MSLSGMHGLTFDFSTAQGRMTATILSGIAEFERELIGERIRSGLSRNAFITDSVFGRNRQRPGEIKHLLQILGFEQQQVDLLRRYETDVAGEPEIKALLADLREGQIEIRSALSLLMGRAP